MTLETSMIKNFLAYLVKVSSLTAPVKLSTVAKLGFPDLMWKSKGVNLEPE